MNNDDINVFILNITHMILNETLDSEKKCVKRAYSKSTRDGYDNKERAHARARSNSTTSTGPVNITRGPSSHSFHRLYRVHFYAQTTSVLHHRAATTGRGAGGGKK